MYRPGASNKPSIGPSVEDRRTDGDRKHVMLSATEWLKQKDENNNIVKAPRDGQVSHRQVDCLQNDVSGEFLVYTLYVQL